MKDLLQQIFQQFCFFLGVVSHSETSTSITLTYVFSFLIQVALSVTQIYLRYLAVTKNKLGNVSPMTKIFYQLDQFLNLFSNFSSMLLYHWRHKKMAKWNEKSASLSSILIIESHVNNKRLKFLVLVSLLICPVLLYLNVFSLDDLGNKITEMITNVYMLMMSFCYAGVVLHVLDQYKALNRMIDERLMLRTQERQYTSNNSAKKGRQAKAHELSVQSMRQIHFGLGESVRQVTWIFSDQLVVVLSNFMRGTILAIYFYVMDKVVREVPTQEPLDCTVFFSLRILFYLSILSALLLPCSMVSKESQKTINIVSRLLGRELSEEVRDQLEIFMVQQLHYQAEFQIFDMIKLDIPVIQSMAKIITTYLVILIQFEIALRIADHSQSPQQ
ncbi:uncharacterized protein LOC120353434 [Nilaparvata lugens]|uniref:uncharacterized protein LOC120353434 n=1 Tax=Nilaparvata lugens TaxID=108931 RepID=UPI00193E6B50|nr:uncharacterized protein LOC120353434 [Nilaparvata lugens]